MEGFPVRGAVSTRSPRGDPDSAGLCWPSPRRGPLGMRFAALLITRVGPEALLATPAPAQAWEARLAALRFLASDRLAGRFTGTVEPDSAAAYLARRFRAVGARAPAGGSLVEFAIAPGVPGLRDMPPAERPARGVNVVG